MKKLILLLVLPLILACSGCVSTGSISGPNSPPSAVVAAQEAVQKTLLAQGAMLQTTPAVLEALYASNKLSKDDYNAVVGPYNQAIAAYKVAVAVVDAAIKAGKDPSLDAGVGTAYADFLRDRDNVNNLLTAMGAAPIDGSGGVR